MQCYLKNNSDNRNANSNSSNMCKIREKNKLAILVRERIVQN